MKPMLEEPIEELSPISVEEAAAMAASQDALVTYVPKSKATFKMETLIPRTLAFEVQKALSAVVKRRGNIDNYVRDHLKYATVQELWNSLSAEQVDAVALYLEQFDKDMGIIIADQTGIGKGRQAAAVIRHATMNGYLPIFFTRKPDLFTDMLRDLKSIGFDRIRPFIVNTDTNARIKDADGHVVFSPLSPNQQKELLTISREVPTESPESIEYHKSINKPLPDPDKYPTVTLTESIDYLPEGYDCIFCTYSQVQAAQPYKRLWLSQLVSRGVEGSKRYKKVVFILDESHMAGSFDSIVGKWMREVLPRTKACCFLSATFAKYPEVMPFYGKKTSIQETNMEDEKFVGAMQRGGLALQEIVASNLAESGQLIRRQRSGEGIRVEYQVLDKEPQRSKNRASVDRIIRLMNQVVEFEERFILPILNDIHAETRKAGEHMDSRPQNLGVKQAPYFSRVFNIVDQMLFALKVEEVAKEALRLLHEDKKVVIAFKSTMGAFLKDLNLASGDALQKEQLDFSRTLMKGLDSIFYYSYTDIAGEKTRMRIELEELPANGQQAYHALKKAMAEEDTGLTISPIDQLLHIIQNTPKPAHLGGHNGKTFRVAEVTGRNQRIRFEADQAIVEAFRADTEKSFRLFNQGHYDMLLINQSGSTGSSAHASKDFEDQRIRAMIIHQFELDINTEVQKRGRTNRTGQVELPEYYYVTSDIPMEKRLMTMLKAKLKSLDANTTGSQKTNDDTLKSPDFFNKYGDKVAWEWVSDNQGLVERMGWPTYHRVIGKFGDVSYVRNDSDEGAIKQVTGRAGLLSVAEQDKVYNDLLSRYEHRIKWEKERGTYDLETEFLKLDARIEAQVSLPQRQWWQYPIWPTYGAGSEHRQQYAQAADQRPGRSTHRAPSRGYEA
ncbi:strawberry notch family protein [Fulvivirga ulvae]|uniref:strawberry notch C-terminal domain-containing protein n=1 Tax=Fulvivirga ulvae TaxID=2904245 RepID=UPI001F371F36|nr:strawberry notch C-terminal domain-containing protein [Fulvivirga ulvae]UII32266.1 strawberry notch family protein [Fulvivirga ulvae]